MQYKLWHPSETLFLWYAEYHNKKTREEEKPFDSSDSWKQLGFFPPDEHLFILYSSLHVFLSSLKEWHKKLNTKLKDVLVARFLVAYYTIECYSK